MDPGAAIKPHKDTGFSFEQGKVRIHIPIQTNDKVEIEALLAKVKQQQKQGHNAFRQNCK